MTVKNNLVYQTMVTSLSNSMNKLTQQIRRYKKHLSTTTDKEY